MIANIIKYGLSEGVAKIAPFLTTLYVAKFLSPELFGKYSLIIVMFEITFILISFNIQATTRIDYFKESHITFCQIKQNHIAISLIFAFLGLVSIIFLSQEEQFVLLILIVSALLRTFSVFILAIFQCSKKVNAYIYSNIIFVFVLAISVFMFVNLGASFYSWLYAMLIASSVQFILVVKLHGLIAIKKYLPSSITFESLKVTFIPAALFMPQAIGWWLKSGAERIIIANGIGNAALGVYSLALQFSSILFIYVTVLNLAIVPEINRLMQRGDYKRTYRYLLACIVLLLILACALPFLGGFVIDKVYSSEYLLAKNYLLFLTIASVPQAIMMFYINILYFNKEGKFVATTILLSFSIQTLINFMLIDYYAIQGLIVCSFIINTIALIFILKKINRYKSSQHLIKIKSA